MKAIFINKLKPSLNKNSGLCLFGIEFLKKCFWLYITSLYGTSGHSADFYFIVSKVCFNGSLFL